MSRRTLHNYSYLYPCQLSSLFHTEKGMNNKQIDQEGQINMNIEFVFYSPMDSYLNVYKMETDESEMVNLKGRRFSLMESMKIKYEAQQQQQQQNDDDRIILLTNSQEIVMIFNNTNNNNNIVHPIQQQQQLLQTATTKHTILTYNLQQKQEKQQHLQIVSNALITTSDMRYKNITNNNSKSFNIIYLTKTIQNNQINNFLQQLLLIELNICLCYYDVNTSDRNFIIDHNSSNSRSDHFKDDNPEEQLQNQYRDQVQKINKIHRIPLPQLQSSIYQTLSQQFTLYQSDRNEILIFDKLQERICCFDLEYRAITSVIQCSAIRDNHNIRDMRNGGRNNMLQVQGRKVAILSNNLLLEYDSMALIKLIDKRVNRIVQIRDLNEEFHDVQQLIMNINNNNNNNNNNHHNRQSPLYHQRFIKLWNPTTNHTQNYHHKNNSLFQSTNFLINMNNKIINVDLRYSNNNGAEKNILFEIEKGKTIGNYDIGMNFDNKSCQQRRVVAYTVEDQLAFRSCVVVQGQGDELLKL